MRIGRRSLIASAIAVIGSAALPGPVFASTRSKRILILGGTNYVGPHLVHSALGGPVEAERADATYADCAGPFGLLLNVSILLRGLVEQRFSPAGKERLCANVPLKPNPKC